jgi:hypothetical protein
MVASSVLFGLNQAKFDDTSEHQIEDFALGALKGAGTKIAFDYFGGKKDWNFAGKGVAMGASSRGFDVALTRQTWVDQNGAAQPLSGLRDTGLSMFHPAALAMDIATFGTAHYGMKFANVLAKGAIEARPLLQNALTGTTFGFTSGSLQELHRQITDSNEHFDPLKILARGGASAATMTLAAGSGFKLTELAGMEPVVAGTKRSADKPFAVAAETTATGVPPEATARTSVSTQTTGEARRAADVITADGEVWEQPRTRGIEFGPDSRIQVKSADGTMETLSVSQFRQKFGVTYTPTLEFAEGIPPSAVDERQELWQKHMIGRWLSENNDSGLPLTEWVGDKVRRGFTADVYLAKVNDQIGHGLFANQPIYVGDIIGEYTGVVEPSKGNDEAAKNPYLYRYLTGGDGKQERYEINAREKGNYTRFINHSEYPNAQSIEVFVDGAWHALLVATKPLQPGNQILFDYGEGYWGPGRARPQQL